MVFLHQGAGTSQVQRGGRARALGGISSLSRFCLKKNHVFHAISIPESGTVQFTGFLSAAAAKGHGHSPRASRKGLGLSQRTNQKSRAFSMSRPQGFRAFSAKPTAKATGIPHGPATKISGLLGESAAHGLATKVSGLLSQRSWPRPAPWANRTCFRPETEREG